MNTEILLDHEPVADGGYLVRALLRITGEAPAASDRPPLNLALVLDRSGSMRAMGKLECAKEAASLLVRRIGEEDTVALVTYDDEVETAAGRTRGARRAELLEAIGRIHPGGTTNLSGGWLRGRELAAEAPVEDGVNRVLLLSDGLANVGITDPGQLRDLVASAAAGGVTTTTIGFGADYDEDLLRALAEAGGGSAYYIEEGDQAPAVFEGEIEGLLALAAQNVAVTIENAPGTEIGVIYHRYPHQAAGERGIRLELGDLYALEPRALLVHFLVNGDAGAELDVATFTVEGHVLLPGGGVEKRTHTLPVRVTPSEAAVVNPEVRKELLLQEAAKAREEALRDRAFGRYQDGAKVLRRGAERLGPYAPADEALRDEMEDLRELAERFDEEKVDAMDAKWMAQRAYGTAWSKTAASEAVREGRARKRRGPSPRGSR